MVERTLAYLQRTKSAAIVFVADGASLHGYSDANFSPEGLRSHGGWCILLFGCPVACRSERQPFVTLSTAECELVASIECAVALESIEALLDSVGFNSVESASLPSGAAVSVQEKVLHVDSQAALAISDCQGSWRTRHLRVRAEYLREQARFGKLRLCYVPGAVQLADLLTKALPSARTHELLRLWSVSGLEVTDAVTADQEFRPQATVEVDRAALFTLLALLQIQPAQAAREETYELQLDGSLEFYFVAGVAIMCLVVFWEWVKRLWDQLDAWWTGSQASSHRARRLRRMQRAIEDELAAQLQSMKLEGSPLTSEPSRPPHGEAASSVSSQVLSRLCLPLVRCSLCPPVLRISLLKDLFAVRSVRRQIHILPFAGSLQPIPSLRRRLGLKLAHSTMSLMGRSTSRSTVIAFTWTLIVGV